MPLKALMDGRPVLSFALPPGVNWEAVKGASRRGELFMSCCGVPAIAKTLHGRGTRFFAHKGRSGCDWAGESAEHERFKVMVAEAAIRAGWSADTEVSGPGWRADVLAEKDGRRVAIEIQLSPQTAPETERRSKRYVESGIECIWFFKRMPPGLEEGPNMPAFEALEQEYLAKDAPGFITFEYLTGEMVWNEARIQKYPISLTGYDVLCGFCGTVWHNTPYYLLRGAEVEGSLMPAREFPIRDLDIMTKRDILRSHDPESDPLGRVLGYELERCPTCKSEPPESLFYFTDAALWPFDQIDGWEPEVLHPHWGERPRPPIPYVPHCTLEEWRENLSKLGLSLSPEYVAEHAPAIREAWQKRVDEDRRKGESLRRRMREDQEERVLDRERKNRIYSRAIEKVEGVGGPIDVKRIGISVARPAFRLKFDYNKDVSDYINRKFGAKWDAERKEWRMQCIQFDASGSETNIKTLYEFLTKIKNGWRPYQYDGS